MNSAPALLVLARHAESARNQAKLGTVFFCDDAARGELAREADHLTALTERGWEQARQAGRESPINVRHVRLRLPLGIQASGGHGHGNPQGVALADVALRVHLFLESVKHEIAGKSVLIVSHSGTMRTLRYWLERWTPDEFDRRFDTDVIPNCGLFVYRPSAEGKLVRNNLAGVTSA